MSKVARDATRAPGPKFLGLSSGLARAKHTLAIAGGLLPKCAELRGLWVTVCDSALGSLSLGSLYGSKNYMAASNLSSLQ